MVVNITYGSTLGALQYAIQNNTKIIINRLSFPLEYEKKYIKEAWALLYTRLMLSGKTIGGDTVKQTKVDDEFATVVCKGNIINKVKYNKFIVFCDKDIIGLPAVKKENKAYNIIDYMKPVSLVTKKGFHTIRTKDAFVSCVYVLKKFSTAPIKIYVLSELSEEQLSDFDFSDTMEKFKSEHLLQENGFNGNIMNYFASNPQNDCVFLFSLHKTLIKWFLPLYIKETNFYLSCMAIES